MQIQLREGVSLRCARLYLRQQPILSVKSPFASVAEAATYLLESKRTVRELVARGVFRLAPNSNGREKPWRLLWSEIEAHAVSQIEMAA
jgi:hypothetical protein